MVGHSLPTLIGQRVVAIALGYEDLINHDALRFNPVSSVLSGKLEAKRLDCAPARRHVDPKPSGARSERSDDALPQDRSQDRSFVDFARLFGASPGQCARSSS